MREKNLTLIFLNTDITKNTSPIIKLSPVPKGTSQTISKNIASNEKTAEHSDINIALIRLGVL